MAAVSIQGLTKHYGGPHVVADLDLEIADGEFLTLLGPSGCGKTTILRCIAGLERPDGGEIRFDGDLVACGRGRFVPPERRDLGMVFQSYALWPHMTVRGNVGYPLRMRRTPKTERDGRITAALDQVGLAQLADRPVGALSGGQQQRVALARALVARPGILLFDEPLSNLDARLRAAMREQIQALRRTLATTSVYVTHDQVEALTLSDRIVVLNDGVIQQVGTPEKIYAEPANAFVADFVGFENLLPATIVAVNDDGVVAAVEGLADCLTARTAGQDPFTVGDQAVLAVRAASVSVSTAGEGVTAEVATAAFLGDQIEYSLRAGPRTIRSRAAAPAVAHPGDTVAVAFPVDGLLALHP
ncbi:ABC transporter ATP-binding protein [Actinomadura sp. NPDC048032]|uniref:ABC transporter ATP-binding protein n=1 Tax=Actinomadura sp. NPDC048032 TaxID=3155747 RepID=UPI00340904C9